jgi:hypothetical protein
VQGIVERLLGEQMADGGWNCEQERGSTRGSFHTTICVLEGLLEHERATGGSPLMTAARERGQAYLLERHLFRRRSGGDVIDPAWTQFSFPTGYHYDVLRGHEYLRGAGVTPDARMAEAIELVASKRDASGRWRTRIPTSWTPSRARSRASRAVGTRCAPYACWIGMQQEPDAAADAGGVFPQPSGRTRAGRPG